MRKSFVLSTALLFILVLAQFNPLIVNAKTDIHIEGHVNFNQVGPDPIICPPGPPAPCPGPCFWSDYCFHVIFQADNGIKSVSAIAGGVVRQVNCDSTLRSCSDNPVKYTRASICVGDMRVECPQSEDKPPTEKKIEFKVTMEDCAGTKYTVPGTVIFKCVFCKSASHTMVIPLGSGCTTLSAGETKYTIKFYVLNIDEVSNLVNLQLSNTQGWAINPPIPSSLQMAPGECVGFFDTVTVPGGLPDGTTDIITLTAHIDGIPDSASASVTITVSSTCAIPTLTEWGLIIFGVVLLGFITWVFLRRRRAVVSLR